MPDTDERNAERPYIYAHCLQSEYERMLDLLRNEGPVYLRWVGTETNGQAAIVTSPEPVGDGERSE